MEKKARVKIDWAARAMDLEITLTEKEAMILAQEIQIRDLKKELSLSELRVDTIHKILKKRYELEAMEEE